MILYWGNCLSQKPRYSTGQRQSVGTCRNAALQLTDNADLECAAEPGVDQVFTSRKEEP